MQGTLCCATHLCIIIPHFGSLGQDCDTIKWWTQLFTCDHRAGSNLWKPSLKPSTIVISSSLVTLQFLQSARSGILNKPASTCKIFIRKSSMERRMSDPIISCRYNLFTNDFKALMTQKGWGFREMRSYGNWENVVNIILDFISRTHSCAQSIQLFSQFKQNKRK